MLERIIQNMTDEELREAYDDFCSYRKTGILREDSVIREVRGRFADTLVGREKESWDMGCLYTINDIMFEIARRYYTT